MEKINVQKSIKTTRPVVPMIYAYTTPEIARHNGWTKIGQTEQEVGKRVAQQLRTADVYYNVEWNLPAVFDDGSGETFKDTDFHRFLRKEGIEQSPTGKEWYHIKPQSAKTKLYEFKETRGILKTLGVSSYTLREEQREAVDITEKYFLSHPGGEFLWNAKPRFGKTLATYDLCKKLRAKSILILTNRPAIANSWYQDYAKFLGDQSNYKFISTNDNLKEKKYVMTRETFESMMKRNPKMDYGTIEFISLQDLKGSIYFSSTGRIDKLEYVRRIHWDLLVIDEAHEGIDTIKTDIAFDQIQRKNTLHLSGTPFKALANDKFSQDAIFNWTYTDEQEKKENWGNEEENPYAILPKLNMFTYQMSEIIREELKKGLDIKGETEEYAFDLNEFFSTTNGTFVHESAVDRFLDALTTQEKFPFSTEILRGRLKHTLWLLNRVESARALYKKLENHPIFKDYTIILAAGNGRTEDTDIDIKKSYNRVVKAIAENDKTITLSVGQLTTGITIPEWTAVLMLSNMKSPALYMQAAFRAQNPCLFHNGTTYERKENAYVFDFDPARTLIIFEQFANGLYPSTTGGRGDSGTRQKNIKKLLNFFPVIGEDDEGEMIELDASKVLSIPRRIKSKEVVRKGFMSNFLFQNISMVFGAPKEVQDILNQIPIAQEKNSGKRTENLDLPSDKELFLDQDGEVDIPNEYIIGQSRDLFGEKIYDANIPKAEDLYTGTNGDSSEDHLNRLREDVDKEIVSKVIDPVLKTAKEEYGNSLKKSDENNLKRTLTSKTKTMVDKAFEEYQIKKNAAEVELAQKLASNDSGNKQTFYDEFKQKIDRIGIELVEEIKTGKDLIEKEAKEEAVRTGETASIVSEKKEAENSIRAHLRGFARSIPSFLMAYGDDTVVLENLHRIVPADVFEEVASISLDQFIFLRDGGDYTTVDGEVRHFNGNIFDPVVFNDSISEFLKTRDKLSNYFVKEQKEDIFDYIPPQKNNQIFTPKWVVKKMVDMLEKENPGCFDNPEATFADLYMKSGLYITEIVKRLYNSPVLIKCFPDRNSRLHHIFKNQVYGLAPSEIIYKIATNYILGFDKKLEFRDEDHNLRLADAAEASKKGTLVSLVDNCFKDSGK